MDKYRQMLIDEHNANIELIQEQIKICSNVKHIMKMQNWIEQLLTKIAALENPQAEKSWIEKLIG